MTAYTLPWDLKRLEKFHVNLFYISLEFVFPGQVEDGDDLDNVDEGKGWVPVEEDGGAGEAEGEDSN